MPVSADTHYPMDDDIFVKLNDMSPDWVYYEHFVWEDLSLLDHWCMPTYAPDLVNQTPAGVWNMTISLNLINNSGQYHGYMACENNDSLTKDLFNGEVRYYIDTGPFNITIDTSYWGDGWMRFNLHAVIAEPWLVSSERWLTNWFYINNSLEYVPMQPYAIIDVTTMPYVITEEMAEVQFIPIPFTAALSAFIVLLIKRFRM